MSLALIFPGQGSQHVGMAVALAETYSAAATVLATADEVLGFPLSELMANGPECDLTATVNAQPALLTHSVAILRVVQDRIGPVSFGAGHSLGEFSAHVAAGTLTLEDALTTVRLRGELMFQAGLQRPGAMAAILGLTAEVVDHICARVEGGTCVPANFNATRQVVVSGDCAGVDEVIGLAQAAGAKRVVPLKVSGAFHSPLMDPAVSGLRTHLDRITFHDPAYPVVSNATAETVTCGDLARELLVKQLTSPVRWNASIVTMLDGGADRFFEMGPGTVLCALNRRNAGGVPCLTLGSPTDLESLKC